MIIHIKITMLFLLMSQFSLGFATTYTAAGTLTVSVVVDDACILPTANNLQFPTYNPTNSTDLQSTGLITVQCSKGVNITSIGLDLGEHYQNSTRNMIPMAGGNILPYQITLPSGATFGPIPNAGNCPSTPNPQWLNVSSNWFVPEDGSITSIQPVTVSVCGLIPAQQSVSPGIYYDTVNIMVYFS